MKKRVAYFDFDHTIINCDSDTYYVKELVGHEWSHEMRERYRHHQMSWPQVVSWVSRRLLDEKKYSVHDVKKCLSAIPITQEMQTIFHNLKKQNTAIYILSDANEKFIEWILEANQCKNYVDFIHSNHAHVESCAEGEYLVVQDYSLGEPHGCTLGCTNLCKGFVVNKLQQAYQFEASFYVGDGSNDYCPCTKLKQASDVCFVREGYALQKLVTTRNSIKGKVVFWKDHTDLLQHIDTMMMQ